MNEDKGRTNVQNGMTTWQRSSHPTQTLHICGTMFLHHGDKVAVQISSSELAKVTIKKPSSFSIVQIPEPIQYPSFVARLKVWEKCYNEKLLVVHMSLLFPRTFFLTWKIWNGKSCIDQYSIKIASW